MQQLSQQTGAWIQEGLTHPFVEFITLRSSIVGKGNS